MSRWGGHLLLWAILLVSLPAESVGAGFRIGLLWWPADPTNPASSFVESLYKCLNKQISASCPGCIFVPSESIRDALFPLLEPATQPTTEEAFSALLVRKDIRPRLVKRMDYLVTFTGSTAQDVKGGIVCGGGYGGGGCLGFAWINKDTRISVIIWDLSDSVSPSRHESHVEGTTWIPALILPIPIFARTEAEACSDMSRQIMEFIHSRSP